jgi:hypothetical protein
MRKLFRPRNLVILAIIGTAVAVVVARQNAAAPVSYPDPWTPTTAPDTVPGLSETDGGEAVEAADDSAGS